MTEATSNINDLHTSPEDQTLSKSNNDYLQIICVTDRSFNDINQPPKVSHDDVHKQVSLKQNILISDKKLLIITFL